MSHYEAPIREPLILGHKSYHDITEDIAKPIEGKANKNWYIAFYISLAAMLFTLMTQLIILFLGRIGSTKKKKKKKLTIFTPMFYIIKSLIFNQSF